MAEIDFTVSKEDRALLYKILERAEKLGLTTNRLSSAMDLTATHANTPLRLEAFLKADDFNFRHDFCGIKNCIDRATGKMRKNFVPRFTARDEILDALVSWCWNTEKHLKEARRIQTLPKMKTKKGPPQWKVDTRNLMRKMWLELEKAEPEFTATIGHPTLPTAEAFLEALP